jgi:radical SAM protein with 4Fe4S-binding SPASM domain
LPLRSPVSFFLELTPACNNHCPGCGNAFVRREKASGKLAARPTLQAGQWSQILDHLAPVALRLKLTGGEPTLHPQFETIVERLASLDIPFTLFTNARWPSPRRLIDLLSSISSLEGLLISLHGPAAASHEAFTRTAHSFGETVANVRSAVEAGLRVSLSCILTRHNWHLTGEMLALARRLGAGGVVFNRYLGPEIAGLTAGSGELRSALDGIEALRASGEPVKLGNCVPHCFAPTSQPGCLAGTAFLTVDSWGRVRPCNHSPLLCGDLLQQPLEEIRQAAALERWRQFVPTQCEGCAALATCGGGCRAAALTADAQADPLMRSPIQARGPQDPVELVLFEGARPAGRFIRRDEDFGTLLLTGNRIFPLSSELHPLLDRLDGKTTVSQIQAGWGQAGLDLVGNLYRQGMIELFT